MQKKSTMGQNAEPYRWHCWGRLRALLLQWSVCEIPPTGGTSLSQHLRDTAAPQPVKWGRKIPFGSQAILPFFSVWGRRRCSSGYVHQDPEWPATDSGPPERLSLAMGQRQMPQHSAPISEAEHWVINKHDVLFRAHIHVSMPQTGLGRRLLAMWMSWDN